MGYLGCLPSQLSRAVVELREDEAVDMTLLDIEFEANEEGLELLDCNPGLGVDEADLEVEWLMEISSTRWGEAKRRADPCFACYGGSKHRPRVAQVEIILSWFFSTATTTTW